MGGHRRLQSGGIPRGPSRRFHEISLFPLPQGQYNENMTGDYIWGLLRESDFQYTSKSRNHNHVWTIVSDYWLSLSIYHAIAVFIRPHERQYKNVLVLSQKYNFLCYDSKIKVWAECRHFSIGFRHKQLKYNTWNPGTKIVLHSVIT